MAINKVDYAGQNLIDLTGDTVEANTLAEGITAHDKAGNPIVGTALVNEYKLWVGSQVDFDAINPKDAKTIYFITEATI